jgi:hypothetical protein
VAANTRRIWEYLAAGVLALLTIAVFYSLQDYGPESAIRRFHAAIVRGDREELQRVTEQKLDSQNVARLAVQVQAFMQEGFRYQLLRMQRSPSQVRAAVVYTAPDHQVFPMIWVVEKTGRVWKVDADKTATIMRDSLGIGYDR